MSRPRSQQRNITMANATNATKIRRGGKGKPVGHSKIKYVTMSIFSHHFCLPPVLSPWPLRQKRCKKSCSLVGCAYWMISNREIAGTRQDESVPEHRSLNQSTLTKANPKLSSEGFYGCFYSELPALPTNTISFESSLRKCCAILQYVQPLGQRKLGDSRFKECCRYSSLVTGKLIALDTN